MTGMARAMAGLAILMAMAAPAGGGEADRYWEWGWGSYGLGLGPVSALDVARFDWTIITFGNDPADQRSVDRCNEILRLNPNHKFVIRVWPISNLGDCPENGRRATFLHYLYAPGVKEELLAGTRRQINLILEGVSKPENVAGSFFLEELPGTFSPGVASMLGGGGLQPWLVERFQTDIEADLGAPLDWSNEEHRTWWGQKWVQVMDEIHTALKDVTAGRIVIYYQLTMVNTLDYYEALIEADPANAQIYAKSSFVPIHYADVVKPGLCDGIFGSPKSDWVMQTQAIVTNLNCLLFSQTSLPPFMRSFTLEDTVNLARWQNPGNLGSFLFYQLSEGPKANVWKDIPWQDDSYWTSSEHMRRFGWEYNIGMDVVATNLAPRVELDYSLKGLETGGMTHVQALIHNPRHPSWYGGQADLGLLENAGITLSVPDGFSIPLANNSGDTLDLGNIDADGYRVADWWVRLEKDDPSIPPGQTFRVVVAATSPSDGGITTGEAESSALDQAIPSFETHYAARSGDKWVEPALRRPHYSPVVELEALWSGIDSPELVCDGGRRVIYRDILEPTTLLRIGPGRKATLLPCPLFDEKTRHFGSTPPDSDGVATFDKGYVVFGAGPTPVRSKEKYKIRLTGRTKGGDVLVFMRFTGQIDGKPAAPNLQCLHGGLTDQMTTIESSPIEVPRFDKGVANLHLVFYRRKSEGTLALQSFECLRADMPETGLDVTGRIEGRLADLVGPYTVWTYKDLSDPVPHTNRKIRIRFLKPEEVRASL